MEIGGNPAPHPEFRGGGGVEEEFPPPRLRNRRRSAGSRREPPALAGKERSIGAPHPDERGDRRCSKTSLYLPPWPRCWASSGRVSPCRHSPPSAPWCTECSPPPAGAPSAACWWARACP